jgi:hypothetical protein
MNHNEDLPVVTDIDMQGEFVRQVAIDDMIALREVFRPVSLFVEDPKHSIRCAKIIYRIDRPKSSLTLKIDRHRAEQNLLLSIKACLQVSQELDNVCYEVIRFRARSDADYTVLFRHVAEVRQKVDVATTHITHCLNVIMGREQELEGSHADSLKMAMA